MEKSGRAWQWYGYAVCLTAVITGLICVAGVIDHAFDLSNPLAGERSDGSLSSFEAYKVTRERRPVPLDQRAAPDTMSDVALRTRYEALRSDRVTERTFRAGKGLVTNLILLGIAVVLFVTHWRWLRRMSQPDSGGGA